jgi:hypothetical protein
MSAVSVFTDPGPVIRNAGDALCCSKFK